MSTKIQLAGIGLIGVFAILVVRLADFYSLPETLTFTPLEVVAVLLATGLFLVLGRIYL
ncbi:MAG: hypothetical protein SVU32_00585 [Candidatus Nanohaloarchaea archaeon]|nr:hypothetical protein [Candidatus Nanohaloarchaea archaeon]